jgi:O-antigen ligase
MEKTIYERGRITGLSLIPFVLVFCFLISSFGINLVVQFFIVLLLFIGYIFVDFKIRYNPTIILFFLFFLWTFFMFLKGNATEKIDHYISIPIAFLFVVMSYFYGLESTNFRIKYYIYFFILVYFVLSMLEINCNLILPGNGKYNNKVYQSDFEGIPITTFKNANDFSSAMGMYFIYIYSYCKIQKNKSRYIFLFLSFFIIVLTNSRGVMLSVLLTPLAYSFYNKKRIFRTGLFYLFSLMIFFVFMRSFNISSFYLNKYLTVFFNMKAGNMDSSSLYRLNIIFYAITNVKEILFGLGPNGSSIFLKGFSIVNPHNFFLEILIDYGIIGLVIVALIFYSCFKLNVIISKLDVPEYLKSSCGAVNVLFCLYIFISVVSSSFLNYWPFCWFPVYLTMMHYGIFNRLKKIKISEQNNEYLEYER